MFRHNSSGKKSCFKDRTEDSFSGSRRLTTTNDTSKRVSFFNSPKADQMDELEIR